MNLSRLSLEPAGFQNAIVTKWYLIGATVGSLLLGTFRCRSIATDMEILNATYRFLINTLMFESAVEVFIGSLLIYQMRTMERRFGSRVFFSFLLFSFSVHALIAIPGWYLFGVLPPTGPFFWLFSLLTLYFYLSPPLFPMTRWPLLNISEKSLFYCLATQLALAQFPSSLYGALVGILIGTIYLSPTIPIRGIQFF